MIFPEYRVRLERVAGGAKAITVPYPQNLGLRTKLGGEPDWIQADETPRCDPCQRAMSLVAQIDSIDAGRQGGTGPYVFGDSGMLYVFYCVGCGEAALVQQCY
jgi:hypothetical protein